MRITRVLRWLALPVPWAVEPSDDLRQALSTLGAPVGAETVVRAGYGLGLVVALVGGSVAVLAGPAGLALVVAATLGGVHAVHAAPHVLAAAVRARASAAAAMLVGRAVLRLRVRPSPEAAAAFAASGEDPLAAALRNHVRRARGTPRTGFGTFASDWDDRFPALAGAIRAVERAPALPPDDREAALDRALTRATEGLRERASDAASDLQAPVSALFAFGVVLPLALVGVLPAATAAGLPVSLTALVVGYDLLLPAVLCWVGVRLLAGRPVAFPPPRVTSATPDVADRRVVAPLAGAGVAVVAALAVPRVFPAWTGWPAAVGGGTGTALLLLARPTRAVRSRVRAVEAGLPDALALVGRRVADGAAVERVLPSVADEVAPATGEVFSAAARRQRTLGVDVETAFLGEHGVLAALPSDRGRDAARLLAVAAREGPPAGDALCAFADHLRELRSVERAARADLARVTTTMHHTASAFAPLVGGATVALFDRLASRPAGGATPVATESVPTGSLGLAVAGYVLVLAVVLSVLATGLERGLGRALLADRVGRALLTATAVFLASLSLTGVLTGGL
jgi:hypothetical protein